MSEEKDYTRIHEQLRYWPYTIFQIESNLNIGLIEGRGRQLLFQAINARNLTAFVGSGLSASFGRLTWSDWQDTQFAVVRESANAFDTLCERALPLLEAHIGVADPDEDAVAPAGLEAVRTAYLRKGASSQKERYNVWRWLHYRVQQLKFASHQVTELRSAFEHADIDIGSFPGGEELPMKFQIAQQLHDQLRAHIQIFLPPPHETELEERTIERCWPGARIDRESSAPRESLEKIEEFLGAHSAPALDDLKAAYKEALKRYVDVFKRKQTRVSSEKLTKMLLFDERAHAMITLAKGLSPRFKETDINPDAPAKLRWLEKCLGIYDDDLLKRNIQGLRDKPGVYRVLGAFRFDTVKEIKAHFAQSDPARMARWAGFVAWESKRLKGYSERLERSGAERTYLTPSSRFLVATYLSLLDTPLDLVGEPKTDGPDLVIDKDSALLPRLQHTTFQSRRSLIANRFDPLAKTVRRLGITRYITTNYDLEIERYFQDMGYRKFASEVNRQPAEPELTPPPDDEYRSDPTGGVLMDQTFDRKRASELVAFSAGDTGTDAAVFHLHGRATADDGLVITEHDYMELYLREDEHRDSVNEAITMAFSSAPLVFLGLGMSEADLLRPLRQFMSNRDRTMGYQAVAILPGEKPIEARTKFAVTCFVRYGVHTIFYGSGMVRLGPEGAETGEDVYLDWLCRMLELVKSLSSELKKYETGEGLVPVGDMVSRLCAAVKTVDTGGGAEAPFRTLDALSVLFGRAVDVTQDIMSSAEHRALADVILSGTADLRSCRFVPAQIEREDVHSRHHDPRVAVDGDEYVGFATGLLSHALRIFLRLHSDGIPPDAAKHDIAALRTTFDGLFGAFLTGALNAQLIGLEKEWRSWWENWQQSPPHRMARFQHLPRLPREGRGDRFGTARFIRHRVDSIITNTEDIEGEVAAALPFEKVDGVLKWRDGTSTRVRAFDTFIEALNHSLPPTLDPKRRLLLTVAAHRGLGKGTFLSAMSSSLGLTLYDRVIWAKRAHEPAAPFLAASLFVNLSFSTEIASCFDALTRALLEINAALDAAHADLQSAGNAARVRRQFENSVNPAEAQAARPYAFDHPGSAAQSKYDEYKRTYRGVSRMKMATELFSEFRRLSEKLADGFPGFGRPRLLVYLSGLELVYDTRGEAKNGEVEAFFNAIFSKKSAEVPIDFVFVGSEHGLGLPFSDTDAARRLFRNERLVRDQMPLRASEMIEERMENGRIKIDARSKDGVTVEKPTNYVHFARPVSPASLLVDNFPTLAMAFYLFSPPEITRDAAGSVFCDIRAAFSDAVTQGRKDSDKQMAENWGAQKLPHARKIDEARRAVWTAVRAQCGDALLVQERSRLSHQPEEPSIEGLLIHRLTLEGNVDRADWRRIRRRVGNNRFTITLLLAAADFIVVHADDAMAGAEEAEEFIHSTVDQVRNVGLSRREELILQIVLERYRRYHVIADADLDVELHLLILRHLAVIGSPTSSSVLVRLPEIRAYFQKIGTEVDVSRRRFLTRALNVMAYRGLIFRIDPHPRLVTLAETEGEDDKAWPADQDFRYALHRTVQSFAIAKTGVGSIDPVRNNSFAPRLYVSMPSVGTGLSFESYQFLRALLIGLSQYPDIQRKDTALMPWLFSSNSHSVKAQALRAALSLARSCLSVATLSRFPAHADRQSPEAPRLGLLENYKIRLRWIVRMAWELVDQSEVDKAKEDPAATFKRINPLYRDEIVWIYNELGVISLSQGNLNEALGFLRQSAEFNEQIEGRSRLGPIYDYIDLNHAIVQMERGRMASAEMRLGRIKQGHEAGTPLHSYAEGYLCVISHIRGRLDRLDKRFSAVVSALQRLGDNRATAIFLAHSARFSATLPDNTALHDLVTARGLAETGGHEDIRHHIEVSRITVDFRLRRDSGAATGTTNTQALEQLREIEVYGRRMDIWSLQVDALKLRAEILMNEGETSSAGALLVRAMAISKRYRMVLRLNSALTIYAQLLQKRNDLDGAQRHARMSLDMAKGIGYSMQTASAQRILSEINP